MLPLIQSLFNNGENDGDIIIKTKNNQIITAHKFILNIHYDFFESILKLSPDIKEFDLELYSTQSLISLFNLIYGNPFINTNQEIPLLFEILNLNDFLTPKNNIIDPEIQKIIDIICENINEPYEVLKSITIYNNSNKHLINIIISKFYTQLNNDKIIYFNHVIDNTEYIGDFNKLLPNIQKSILNYKYVAPLDIVLKNNNMGIIIESNTSTCTPHIKIYLTNNPEPSMIIKKCAFNALKNIIVYDEIIKLLT
jgi:hypothetical protein